MRRKDSWNLEIGILFLLFIAIPLASAEINFNYPAQAEYGKTFSVSLELVNLSGIYDVKIDMLNSSNSRISSILNNGEYKSTYYYIIGAINTSTSNSSEFSMNITEKYSGVATINITLRKGSSTSKFGPYSIDIVYNLIQINDTNTTESQDNQTNPENQTDISNQTSEIPDENNSEQSELSGYNYSIIEYPSELAENFIVKIKIINNEDTTKFSAWSYVYSGSICYSIDGRESNKIITEIAKAEKKIIELNNQVNLSKIDLNKTYRLKVKILREGLKTEKEFTYELSIPKSLAASEEKTSNSITSDSEISGENPDEIPESATNEKPSEQIRTMSYESKSMSAARIAVYIFASLMTLFSIYLIIKK